jgi:TRAP-type C4-dicarboxylate transport system substrate-binding protein
VAQAQDIQERTIRFGHLNNPDHPTSLGVKKFAELVAAKSGGKITVKEYPSSQLGNELQQQSALQGGVQEMLVASTTSLAGIVKEFGCSTSRSSSATPAGRCHGRRPARQDAQRQAGGQGRGRAGLLRPGLSQRHQQQAAITKAEDLEGLKLRVIPIRCS